METTVVKIIPAANGPLKALATVVFDDVLVWRGVKILEHADGEFEVRLPEYPMAPGFGEIMTARVLAAYNAFVDSRASSDSQLRVTTEDGTQTHETR